MAESGKAFLSSNEVTTITLWVRKPLVSTRKRTKSTKVKAKTVSLALSADQADWLEQAIAEHRRVKKNSSPICAASPAKSCAPSFLTRNDAPP